MKKKITHSAVLIMLFLISWSAQSQDSKTYTEKTYLFLGNSLVEKFNSIIDTANYTSEVRYQDGRIMERYYPKYGGELERTEVYQYNEFAKIEKIVTKTKSQYSILPAMDSTVYQYKQKDGEYDIWVKVYGDFSLEQHYTIIADTSFIEEFINGKYTFTMREYKKGDKAKVRQIIKPNLSEIVNTFYYDEFNNELRYEKTENGETDVTMRFEYEYDEFNRITRKQTFLEPGHELTSVEISIYDK